MKLLSFKYFFLTILLAGTFTYALSCCNNEEMCCCKTESPQINSKKHLSGENILITLLTEATNNEFTTINSGHGCGVCLCDQNNSEPGNQRNAISVKIAKQLLIRHISHLHIPADYKQLTQISIKILHNSPPAFVPLRI